MIYLDTNLLIYAVEGVPEFATRVMHRMEQEILRSGGYRFAISPLVKMECLVKPVRDADLRTQGWFEAFFSKLETLDMPETVYRAAAALRASHGLRTPDALHLACALHHGCSALWTHDARLAQASQGLAVDVLSA